MNRRKLLSLIGATALSPVIPSNVFASGGIVNPEHCGFLDAPVDMGSGAKRWGIVYVSGGTINTSDSRSMDD